jgi:transposase-like protein
MKENLNFQHHYKILIVKALNKSKTIKDASKLLGITDRTLYRWIKQFEIKKTNNYDNNN